MRVWKVTFKGLVQGVCFRFYVNKFFEQCHPEIAGTVRNLSSGEVEVVIKSDNSLLTELRTYCESKICAAKIVDVEIVNIADDTQLPYPFRVIS